MNDAPDADSRFRNDAALLFIPDGTSRSAAFRRTTHIGIGAHPDDLEVMAYHGIRECYHDPAKSFAGVVCTDGGGSPRSGRYAQRSGDEMRRLRAREQVEAAKVGRYSFVAQLGYSSEAVNRSECPDLSADLSAVLEAVRPRFVYTHNPADLHPTHVSVSLYVVEALRDRSKEELPEAVYGCEVWRGLDWMLEEDKIALDVGPDEDLAKRLIEVFPSQNEAGKNYLAATLGRRRANATYHQPYAVDRYGGVCFAMDLLPLVRSPGTDVTGYVLEYIDRFRRDVENKLGRRDDAAR